MTCPQSNSKPSLRCAIYTRKSSNDGLELDFNSLDAQRDSAEAYIRSQAGQEWVCLPDQYDDGGYSGGNLERPALKRLMADIEAGKIDCVVIYKIDRLSRSLLDFTRLMETLEKHHVSFVSVTQQFNTANSMGRLMLNVLLSFAQFEREIISERTRDKIAATRRKGKWTGGHPILGYDIDRTSPGGSKLRVNEDEAQRVRDIFHLYLKHGSMLSVAKILNSRGWHTKAWTTKKGRELGGKEYTKNAIFKLLRNQLYLGKVTYKDEIYEGEHEAIVPQDLWNKVQAQLQHNGRTGGAEVRNKYGAILKGIIRCVPCNSVMNHSYSRSGNRRYRYYVCGSAQQKGWHTCPSKSVPAPDMEQFVLDQIRCIGHDPAIIAETLKQAQEYHKTRRGELEREQRMTKRELHDSEQALSTTTDTGRLSDLHDFIRLAERRLTEMYEEIKVLDNDSIDEATVRTALADFDTLWSALIPRQQHRLMQLLIDRVEYDGRDGTVRVIFRPTGIRALVDEHTRRSAGLIEDTGEAA